ncbi:hypothetical protein HKD37_05G014140 [Glycine soja]
MDCRKHKHQQNPNSRVTVALDVRMGNRRFTQVATSDDEDEAPPAPAPPPKQQSSVSASEENCSKQQQQQQQQQRKRKRMKLQEEEEEEKEEEKKKKRKIKDKQEERSNEEEEPPQEDAKPIGEPVRLSGKGRGRKKHYESFEYDGNQYTLEDPILLTPEDKDQKPYVAIIKRMAVEQLELH